MKTGTEMLIESKARQVVNTISLLRRAHKEVNELIADLDDCFPDAAGQWTDLITEPAAEPAESDLRSFAERVSETAADIRWIIADAAGGEA